MVPQRRIGLHAAGCGVDDLEWAADEVVAVFRAIDIAIERTDRCELRQPAHLDINGTGLHHTRKPDHFPINELIGGLCDLYIANATDGPCGTAAGHGCFDHGTDEIVTHTYFRSPQGTICELP